MKSFPKLKLGIFLIGTLSLTSTLTQAQTTANGPYYATPSWDQTLPASTRFIVLSNMNSEAVLDRETGLVWEKSGLSALFRWTEARVFCANKTVGGRKGWRLPSFQELASLVDPSVPAPGPTLPAGHPFTNVQNFPGIFHWSATKFADASEFAWYVRFDNGVVDAGSASAVAFVWCVRGGGVLESY